MQLSKNEKFETMRERLALMAEDIKNNGGVENPNYKTFKYDFKRLYDLVVFSLMTDKYNYFANVLLRLERRFNYGIPTPTSHQCTSNKIIFFINPLQLVKYDIEIMKMYIVHECYHVCHQHSIRIEKLKDKYMRTILLLSSDLAVNNTMLKEGDNIPSKWWTCEKLKNDFDINIESGLSLEEYAGILSSHMKNNKEFSLFINSMELLYNAEYRKRLEDMLQSANEDELAELMEDEENPLITGFKTNDMDFELISDMLKYITIESASDVRGTLPSGVASLLEKLTKPPVITWQEMLSNYIGTIKAGEKSSIFRRDRRQPYRLDLKGKLPDKEVHIVCAIDTSGSVSNAEIQDAMTEIFDITKHIKTSIHVIECDAEIQNVYEAKNEEDLQLNVNGRGGTYFTPVFQKINEEMWDDCILVYFTDGYGENKIKETINCQGIIWVLTRGDESCLSVNIEDIPVKSVVKTLKA